MLDLISTLYSPNTYCACAVERVVALLKHKQHQKNVTKEKDSAAPGYYLQNKT